MDEGYARFRRLNDEANRESRRRQYEALQASRERADAERRHRELVAATKASRSIARENYQSGSAFEGISLKTVLLLFSAALLLFAVSMLLGRERPPASTPEAPVPARPDDEVDDKISSDGLLETSGEKLSREQHVAPPAATEPGSAELTHNLEELRGPILRALDTGERVEWEVNGTRGYVMVSALAQTTEGPCRTVLIGSAAKIAPDVSSVWCRKDSADWVRVESTGVQE